MSLRGANQVMSEVELLAKDTVDGKRTEDG